MPRRRHIPVALALAAVACTASPAALAATSPPGSSESAMMRALVRSRELWATIDLCSPSDQPHYVGVRGSMPGDHRAHDKMYMSFRLQYQDASTRRWANLSPAGPSFVFVGPGSGVRQGGRSFQLVPRSPHERFNLRGVVEYQWRRGSKVLQATTRTTSAGHTSLAGADPPGYSSATCRIG